MTIAAGKAGPAAGGAVRLSQVAADRRQNLLDAGLELFASRGFSGVSIREIASLAGVNVALLYHYFGDKRALYEAVLEDAIAREAAPHAEVLAGEGEPRARLHAFVVNLLDSMVREDPRRKLIERMWMDVEGDIPPAARASREELEPRMKALIAELAPGGGEIPWPVISGVISGLPQAILRSHRAYEPARALPTQEEFGRLAEMLTNMMIATLRIAAQEAADHRAK